MELEDSRENKYNFKNGEILSFVRVRFAGQANSLPFYVGKSNFKYGEKVLAMSDRGMTVGYINSFPYPVAFKEDLLPIKTIKRSATEEDIKLQIETYHKEKEYEVLCKNLIEKYNLDMNLTHVEFTQYGKKVVFYFIAPERIDFRDLVKDLVGEIKLRIELRQISLRDRSAAIGGIGSCGRQLCCSSFLAKYGQVNLKMAKTQDLSLNFSKLNGVCGQIKCCIKYENEVYQHKSSLLPEIKSIIKTKQGDIVRVDKHYTLSEEFEGLASDGVRRKYVAEEFLENMPTSYVFPNQFDHISDETANVIGAEEKLTQSQQRKQAEIEQINIEAQKAGKKIFEEHKKYLDEILPDRHNDDGGE